MTRSILIMCMLTHANRELDRACVDADPARKVFWAVKINQLKAMLS